MGREKTVVDNAKLTVRAAQKMLLYLIVLVKILFCIKKITLAYAEAMATAMKRC